jgi:dolichyl-phosphate beta-glucosyltransferase
MINYLRYFSKIGSDFFAQEIGCVPSISILIPAYNEEKALRAEKLKPILDWIANRKDAELVFVDDGSLDATADLASQQIQSLGLQGRMVCISHAGKAAAVVAGIQAAQNDIVLFTDMDQATPIDEAPRLLEAILSGAQIAIGSRGLVRPGAPIGRYVLSWGQVGLRWLLLGLLVTDTQCGFKAFTRTTALNILAHMRLYHPDRLVPIQGPSVNSGFDTEFLYVARHLGYPIREIPVHWNYQDTRRVRLVRDAGRGISDLVQIASGRLFGSYRE